MLIAFNRLQGSFSPKTFLLGLGSICALYALIFGYVFIQSTSTLANIEARLASRTVIIEKFDTEQVEPQKMADSKPEVTASLNLGDKVDLPDPGVGQIEELQQLMGTGAQSLKPAPVANVYETTEDGLLPAINPNTLLTPFEAYKRDFLVNQSRPALAIAILDYGLSEELSKQILVHLPSTVSLILSPYGENPDGAQKMAREDGHEIWLQTHFETEEFPHSDIGPYAFLKNASFSQNQKHLTWLLTRTTGYSGLVAYTDSLLSRNESKMKNLMSKVFMRGLGYFELNPKQDDKLKTMAVERSRPYLKNMATYKDLRPDSHNVEDIISTLSHKNEMTIVVKPTPNNLKDLKSLIKKLENEGVQIVPISALAALTLDRVQ